MDARFDYKSYRYTTETRPELNAQYQTAPAFCKVRVGQDGLFWKAGLRRHYIPFDGIKRIYRRVEGVYGRLCCGGRNFDMEYLVLDLPQGGELVIHIGDDVKKRAEALLEHLKQAHPEIPYGKV